MSTQLKLKEVEMGSCEGCWFDRHEHMVGCKFICGSDDFAEIAESHGWLLPKNESGEPLTDCSMDGKSFIYTEE